MLTIPACYHASIKMRSDLSDWLVELERDVLEVSHSLMPVTQFALQALHAMLKKEKKKRPA